MFDIPNGNFRFSGYPVIDNYYDGDPYEDDEEWPPNPNRQRGRKIPLPQTAREYELMSFEASIYFDKELTR